MTCVGSISTQHAMLAAGCGCAGPLVVRVPPCRLTAVLRMRVVRGMLADRSAVNQLSSRAMCDKERDFTLAQETHTTTAHLHRTAFNSHRCAAGERPRLLVSATGRTQLQRRQRLCGTLSGCHLLVYLSLINSSYHSSDIDRTRRC